ncbi:MAG: 4a-hydroxytetrahydrobiopterin dehydratase [Planctomycetota bacterium]|nr:MAG: 4a-hydroxytetrahydrobiopterin dehydratase [Planctomycetota bacterium]
MESPSQSTEPLSAKKCVPCEGGVPRLSPDEAQTQLARLQGWQLDADATRIRKQWIVEDFAAAMEFLNLVAAVAEEEGHHPDFHLERYRYVTIESWTHAIGGLSLNDFIVAAKIDQLPVRLQEK